MNVLITGSNRGIGLEAARQLGSKGNRVFITARKKADPDQTISDLTKIGIDCKGYLLDLNSTESIEQFLQDFDEPLDILINNAGVHLEGTPSKISKSNLHTSLNVNLIGPWHLTTQLIPRLEKSKNPKIINVSSGAGAIRSNHHSPVRFSGYRISKFAFNEFTRLLSQELPTWSINAVCPGWVRTDMGGKQANLSVAQGADTITWLAMENQDTGNFYRGRRVIKW